MKLSMKILIASAACVALLPSSSFADPAATANFTIKADLQQTIVLTHKQDLQFPAQSMGTAGSYLVAPTDPGAAQFSAIGSPTGNAELSFTTATATLTCVSGACLTSGTNTLTVDTFTCGGDLGPTGVCNYQFDADGKINNINLGATEHVANTNQSGTYTGTQSISLNYK